MPKFPNLKIPMALGPHRVPGVWRHMLPEDLAFMKFPSECQSTCDACPKVKEENFHPDVRCCSYHPRVPNFLLGLSLEDPATAPLIEKEIAGGHATPEGLQSSPVEMRRSLMQVTSPDGSANPSVVCRFLDTKNRRCGIYHYRDSVCATFFCKHDQPEPGLLFWRALQSLAGQCETGLSQWAMTEAGLPVDDYVERFDALALDMPALTALTEDAWPEFAQKRLWGEWLGREADFFRACAAHVRSHLDALGAILDAWTIRSPRRYEQALYESLPPHLQSEMRRDGIVSGEAMSISDLWYQMQLGHRNLWQPDP